MNRRSNGEGSIYKRKDGRWCGAYYDEEFNRCFVYGKTQSEVKRRLKAALSKRTVIKQDHQYTFQEWMLEFLKEYKKNDLKPTTYSSYLYYIESHLVDTKIGKKKLSDLRTEHLQKFYNEMVTDGFNSKTIHTMRVIINGGLEMAVMRRMIPENPNTYTSIPKKTRYEAQVLTQEQLNRLIEEAKDEEMYPIVIVTAYTGMRKGEVTGLQWNDVDFEGRKIYVRKSLCRVYSDEKDEKGHRHTHFELLEPKTKSSIRTIPMIDVVYDALKEQKLRQEMDKETYGCVYMDRGMVFAEHNGEFFSEKRFLNKYYKFLEKYELPKIRFHDLRHTFASLLIETDASMKLVQELLGHSTITTSMDIYAHVSEAKKADVMDNLLKKKE